MQTHPPKLKSFTLERVRARFVRNWNTFTEGFKNHPAAYLSKANEQAIQTLCYINLNPSDRQEAINYLSLSNQTAISYYRGVISHGTTITFSINEVEHEAIAQDNKDYFYFGRWLRHLCVAITLRDNAAIQFLCSIKKEAFQNVRLANMPIDDVLMDFIQGMFDPEADHRSLILNMMESTGPENYSQMRANYVAQILLPMANLFMMALTNVDEEKYHEVWRNAVSNHQEYWSSDTELAEDYQGWISFPILAASVLMFDKKGYKLPSDLSDAETIYVPEWLVYGDFESQPSVGVDFYEGEV